VSDGSPERRTLVLVAGRAGTGKTEFAKLIARELRWPVLDKDTLTRPLLESLNGLRTGNPHDRESSVYLQELRHLEYESLMDAALEILENGSSVVATAPFLREVTSSEWIEDIRFEADVRSADCVVVWIESDVESMRSRLTSRNAARDSWKLEHWADYLKQLEQTPEPVTPFVTVENSIGAPISLAAQTQELVRRIAGPSDG